MKNEGIWLVIGMILAVGIGSTRLTTNLVSDLSGKEMQVQTAFSEEIPQPAMAMAEDQPLGAPVVVPEETLAKGEGQALEQEALMETLAQSTQGVLLRLEELDQEIERTRAKEVSESGGSSLTKQRAESEYKLWQSELDQILDALEDSLASDEYARLYQEQNEWVKERESRASSASSKMNRSSLGEVEYTASLTRDTRLRAYELANQYADRLP